MKYSAFAITLATLSTVFASPITRDADSKSGFLTIPIVRVHAPNNTSVSHIAKRSTIPVSLSNQVYLYLATFDLGTPGQSVTAQIDTGSSDLWVYGPNSNAPGASYDPSDSSTYEYLNNDFSIEYVDGTEINGDWVTDTVTIGSAAVTNQQFAYTNAEASNGLNNGVFGIGFESDESTSSEYTNVPQNLKNQGFISQNAYSLYLDDIDANTGTLLFGGIDEAKYSGSMAVLPIESNSAFQVSVSVVGSSTQGILDSGTSLTYLDSDTVEQIANIYGATWDQSQGAYILNSQPSGNPLVYTFGNVEIQVGLDELFIENEDGSYTLTILPNTETQGINLLGDSTLRSAYVVYQLDSNQIGIAQAQYTSSSNIVPITGSL